MTANAATGAALLQGLQATRLCAIVSFTVLYYDYFTTFSMEVERFWKQSPFSCISILFVINRYLSLIGPIPVTIEYFGNIAEIVRSPRCRQLQSFHQYYAVFTQAVVAALLLLRTYALYNRDARILCLMLATCAAGIVASIWVLLVDKTFTEDSKVALNWPGCDLSLSLSQARHLVGAWSSMLAFDTLVFVLTLVRAIQVEGLWKGTLFRIMLRDGALYYGIMVMANLANILTFLLAVPTARGMCTTLTNIISSTLISRLMLNLRDPNMKVLPPDTLSTFRCSPEEDTEAHTTYAIAFVHSEAVFSECFEDDLLERSLVNDCTQ